MPSDKYNSNAVVILINYLFHTPQRVSELFPQFKNFQLNLNFQCCIIEWYGMDEWMEVHPSIHIATNAAQNSNKLHYIRFQIEMILKSNVKIPN